MADLLREALNGREDAVRKIIDRLTPILQRRIGRVLRRYGHNIDDERVRQTVEDLIQDVFLDLFRDDGQRLRRWNPEDGGSLENYVGQLTEWLVLSKIRQNRRNPWTEEPTPDEKLDRVPTAPDPEWATTGKDLEARVLAKLEGELSRRGRYLFLRDVVTLAREKEARQRTEPPADDRRTQEIFAPLDEDFRAEVIRQLLRIVVRS